MKRSAYSELLTLAAQFNVQNAEERRLGFVRFVLENLGTSGYNWRAHFGLSEDANLDDLWSYEEDGMLIIHRDNFDVEPDDTQISGQNSAGMNFRSDFSGTEPSSDFSVNSQPDEITVSIPASVLIEFDNKFAEIGNLHKDPKSIGKYQGIVNKQIEKALGPIGAYLNQAYEALDAQHSTTSAPVEMNGTSEPVDNVEGLESRLDKLESKMRNINKDVNELDTGANGWLKDIEKRIDSMEKEISKQKRVAGNESSVIDDINRRLELLSDQVDTNETVMGEGFEIHSEKIAAVEDGRSAQGLYLQGLTKDQVENIQNQIHAYRVANYKLDIVNNLGNWQTF